VKAGVEIIDERAVLERPSQNTEAQAGAARRASIHAPFLTPQISEIIHEQPILTNLETLDGSPPYASSFRTPRANRRSTQPNSLPQPTAPEPEIHVSIGRIEVRAVADAPASRRAQPATPVMGLEEYLRKVKGGGQ
jgi:hypothetical protein